MSSINFTTTTIAPRRRRGLGRPGGRRMPRGGLALALVVALIGLPARAEAQVTITLASGTQLTLDSNKPCNVGPHAQYVHFKIQNTGGATWTAPSAELAGFANGITLAGGQQPRIYFAPTAAGGVIDAFWYIQYPCTIGTSASLTVTVYDGAAVLGTSTATLSTVAMLSAQAGGNLVAESLTAINLGAITYLSVGYSFGNASAGDTYLVQPAGTPDFNAGCFQLLGNEIRASAVLAMPVGTTNQLTFTAPASDNGSNQQVTVRYTFRALCANTSTLARPFANEHSGQSLKYSGNFDAWGSAGETTVPGAGNPFVVTKAATPDTLHDGGPVTYTVTIRNTSTLASTIDSIVDVLPAGVSYAGLDTASTITAANSTSMPAPGATGRIVWRSVPGIYYPVAAGDSLVLAYRASVPPPEGTYTNAASGYVAATVAGTGSTDIVVRRIADVSVTKTGPTSALVGDTVRYILTIRNAGPSAARTVTLTDTLPAQLALVRATRGGTLTGGVVSWPAVDSMPPNTTVTDTVVAQVVDSGTVVNVAATLSPRLDPDSTNQNGSVSASRVTITLTMPSIAVAVTPDGGSTTTQLAGTAYAQPFTVRATSAQPEAFDLLIATDPGGTGSATADSVTGPGLTTFPADSTRITLADSSTQALTVWYTVPMGDTTTTRFVVTARAVRAPAVRDTGWAAVRRGEPTLTVTKSVSPTTGIRPGIDLTYTSVFRNVGEFAAANTVLEDDVPTAVAFKVGSVVATLPSGITGAVSYSADGGATWGYTPTTGGCGAPAGYDACVRRIRVSLSASLPPDASATSQVVFVARIQ